MGILKRQPSRVRAAKARLYELIDRASSEYLSAPNFALNTDVVSAINGATDQRYAATKACKRLKGRMVIKNPRVQQLALQLLENCVRSCGEPFHAELAKSELFVELLHMADRSSWCTAELQGQVLSLLQEWAYMLKPPQFSNAYNKLKARGLPFPPRDGAPRFEPYPGLSPPAPPPHTGDHSKGPVVPHPHQHYHQPLHAPHAGGPPAPHPHPPSQPAGPPQLLSSSQPPPKIREDLGVASNTVALLQEMLDGVPHHDFAQAKQEFVVDMVAQCREMKERLTRLITELNDEALLGLALQLNDDTQAALDRHSDMVAVAEGRRRPPPAAPAQTQPHRPQAGSQLPAQQAAPASAVSKPPPPPLLDLLSMDSWSGGGGAPSHAPPPPAVAPAVAAPVVDPFLPAAATGPLGSPPGRRSNNPFAPEAESPAPASAPAALPPTPDTSNPFLNDSVFAATSAPPASHPPPPPQVAPATAAAWPAPQQQAQQSAPSGGNPFAAPSSGDATADAFAATPSRPAAPGLASSTPSPDVPQPGSGAFAGYPSIQSPQTGATLYPGSTGQGLTYSSPSPFDPAVITPHPVPAGPYGRPLTDAFGDLVNLRAKEEAPQPPPPRGTPMRTLETSSAVGVGVEGGTSGANGAAAGLSAFDAFDELITTRGPSSREASAA